MSQTNGSPAVTPGQAVGIYNAILKHGDEAWEGWIKLGHFIIERTAIAAAKSGATRGTTYAAALQKTLGATTFYPIYQKLSGNGTLTNLGKCMAKLDEVTMFRNRLKDAGQEPPSHPQRMWAAFEESQRSSIAFEDEGGEDDDDGEEKAPRRHGRAGHNREKELLAEIAALREEIARLHEQYEMTGDIPNDAQRLWRRICEKIGHGESAAKWAVLIGVELDKIGRNVIAQEAEWNQPVDQDAPRRAAAETGKRLTKQLGLGGGGYKPVRERPVDQDDEDEDED